MQKSSSSVRPLHASTNLVIIDSHVPARRLHAKLVLNVCAAFPLMMEQRRRRREAPGQHMNSSFSRSLMDMLSTVTRVLVDDGGIGRFFQVVLAEGKTLSSSKLLYYAAVLAIVQHRTQHTGTIASWTC